ncbi:MAG TPA: DUF2837 family protein [Candidatus Tumulicola sp.]
MSFHSAAFLSWQFGLAVVLNCFVNCILIGAYAARLAGAASGRVATSMSFYNLITMVSRLAAFVYTPMLGALSDRAAAGAGTHAAATFLWQLRAIVLAGAIGAAIGTLLLPAFAGWFSRGIRSFERSGSLPRVALRMLVPRVALSVLATLRADVRLFAGLNLKNVAPQLLAFNVLTTSVYAIGMVGATYASVLDPTSARTALLSTGLINAIAMVSFTFVVDPASAHVTDLAVKGERSIDDVRRLMVWLSLTTVVGILVAQALLVPAAHFVVLAARLLSAR